MIKILYCEKSDLLRNDILTFLTANGFDATCLSIEEATNDSFTGCSLIINAMGSFYADEKMELLVDYF